MRRLLPGLVLALLVCAATSAYSQDTTPPVINCPGNLVFTLSPGACKQPVFFNVSATDNASTPIIQQIDGTGYTSGSNFPRGTIWLTFVAVDSSFNTDTCWFSITINNYPTQSNGLVCDQSLNISMPATCEMWLTPDQVLEGNYGCYDDFVVEVENTGSNYIGYYYVGETITYTVTNTVTGVWCWGEALIEDKSGPLITGCDSVTINCLQNPLPVSEGGEVADPLFTDCMPLDTIWVDMISQGDCQDNLFGQVMRIWSGTDSLGNSSSCTQVITIERIPLASLDVICPRDTTVECDPDEDPNLGPQTTGFPYVLIDEDTFYITDGPNSLCNITASYSDQVIPVCGVSFRITRTWTILDWCQEIDMVNNPIVCKQIITYSDKSRPELSIPNDLTASANLPGCKSRPILPAAEVTDCSEWSVIVITPVGPIAGNGGKVPPPGLSIGTHNIIYKATDACGNSISDTLVVVVVDNVKPTPVCDQFTVVALDDLGYGFAFAESFDNGSTDNCCVKNFKVAKMNDICGNPANLLFGDYIDFCCSEVGQPIQVILRVYDCNNNFNECMVNVEVQDKTGPSITCPAYLTVFCGTDFNNLDITGDVVTDPSEQGPNDGLATDNCGNNITVIHSDEGIVNCGQGLIYRTFKVSDPAGLNAFCVQRITIENNNPFTGNNIIFPADTIINGCASSTLPGNTGQPSLPPPSPCYMLVTAFSDQVFNSIPGACLKIYRTWTVIDMCQYNPNQPNGPGQWTHVQTIMVIDNVPPVVLSCEDRTFCNFKNNCGTVAPDLSITATDACTPDSLLYYSWSVDLNRDATIDDTGNGQNTSNFYPLGDHRIFYNIIDACGNVASCSFDFSIADCKKPVVFCNPGLLVTIMQTGMIDVFASQLEQGSSYDNCTQRPDLRISFSPFVNDTVRTFTCDDVGLQLVQIWVTDEANNQDYCETTVTIQDNMAACADTLVVLAGAITNEQNSGVEGVQVELNGDATGMSQTTSFGQFQFADVPIGYDFTVSPSLNDDPLNGVTTFDIVLLQRHILNTQPLNSPYKIIAGDINNSGTLTVSDVVDLRKVILYILPSFPNNTSWRFVDSQWAFPNPQDPFQPMFPQVCNINNLPLNNPPVDFVAVKVGDLNGSAVTNNFQGGTGDRTVGPAWKLTAPQRFVRAGERVEVPISATLPEIYGYQFTLDFDTRALRFEQLQPGIAASDNHFGLSLLDHGAITASWNQVTPAISEGEERLFALSFTALQDGWLSDALSISSRFTQAEAYDAAANVLDPQLHFEAADGAVYGGLKFELYQNVPNPFTGETVIGFTLPSATQATLRIFDVAGTVVREVQGEFAAGYNEISVGGEWLSEQGVYVYRLETPEFTATRKMTLIK